MNELKTVSWEPWIGGCTKVSPGCLHCFVRYDSFMFNGYHYREGAWPTGTIMLTTLHSDFFLEAADSYRLGAWQYIKDHSNLIFLIITKRVERIMQCLPDDWGQGYNNVILEVTTEDQEMADKRLPLFRDIPAKHKWLSVAPMLGPIHILSFLQEGWIEHIEVTGEKAIGKARNDKVRELRYEWVEDLSNQCKETSVRFSFMSCGSNFKYNEKTFKDHCACYRSCLAQGLELDNEVPIQFNLQDQIITI